MFFFATLFCGGLMGAVSGALAWVLPFPGGADGTPWPGRMPALFVGMFGLILGLGLGLLGAWAANAQVEKKLSVGLGAACGLGGALLGHALTMPVSYALVHTMHGLSEQAQGVLLALGHSFGWGVLGLALGGGLGAARRSRRLAWQAGLGGLVGGLIAGISVEHLTNTSAAAFWEWPAASMLGWRLTASMGANLGMLIAVVPYSLRASWVQVQRGGREHTLARPLMTIGQDKTCDIVLRGDPRVAPVHVTLEAMPGGKHHLTVASGGGRRFAPVLINSRPVIGEQWLADGDALQLGEHVLWFHERATRGALRLGPPQPQVWMQALRGRPPQKPQIISFPASPPSLPDAPQGSPAVAPPEPRIPVLTLESLPLLGLNRDMAALSLDEDAAGKDGDAPLSALPALLSGIVLRAEQGPYVGRAFLVDATAVTRLGRALEQEIPLPLDKTVSRLHARIVPEGDQYLLEDAGSANGTLANGLRLTGRRALRPGDVIQLGATVLRYT